MQRRELREGTRRTLVRRHRDALEAAQSAAAAAARDDALRRGAKQSARLQRRELLEQYDAVVAALTLGAAAESSQLLQTRRAAAAGVAECEKTRRAEARQRGYVPFAAEGAGGRSTLEARLLAVGHGEMAAGAAGPG
jgi:hypothetical protein